MRRWETGVPEGAETIEVDGVRLAYARSGTRSPARPTVVCLHAVAHGARDYEDFAARMAARCDVVRLDWPGHGRSDPDPAPASAARYADLLEGALDALGVERAALMGCSIGGAAALILAARRPERVRGLVLCDPGGLQPIGAREARFIALMTRFFEAGAREAWWFPAAFALYYRVVLPRGPAAAQRRRIIAAARETAAIGADAWRSFATPEADIRDLADRVTAPILFAWAKQDRIVQYAACREAVARFKTGEVALFSGGHAAFLEAPKAFDRAFTAFLEKLDADERL